MNSPIRVLAWNDYLKTGIAIIDQQHRGLIDLINETAAKLSTGGDLGVDELRSLLGFLTGYTKTHFSTEEALMALGGVPEKHVAQHRQSHAGFLAQIEGMVNELGGSGPLTTQHLMDFLGNWLVYHILGEDQNLSRLLQAESPAEADALLQAPGQEAAKRALGKLYAFTADRELQKGISAPTSLSPRASLSELVAAHSAELAASGERFRDLLLEGSLAILVSRLESNLLPGPIIDTNAAAGELLGYSEEALRAKTLIDLVAPEEIARFPLLIKELLVTGKFECEMTHLTAQGNRLTTLLSMTSFISEGHPVAMSVIRDLPARRAAELAKAEVREQAEHLAEVRSEYLAATLGHAATGNAILDATALASLTGEPGRERIAAYLGTHPLFHELGAPDQQFLASTTRLKRLKNGELLFSKGAPALGIHLVIGGHLVLAVTSPQGNKKVINIYGPGESIGEAEVVTDSAYPYYAEAVDSTAVLEIGKSALLAILDRDNQFARRLMNRLGSRQHGLVQDVESYTLRSGAERVIGYLLQHATIHARGPLKVRLPATKQMIASLLHIKPETLSRIFRDLTEAGLIQVKGRNVQIPDIDQLIAYQASEAVRRG